MNINLLKLMKDKIQKEKQVTTPQVHQQKNREETKIVNMTKETTQLIVQNVKFPQNQQAKNQTIPQEKMLTEFQEKKMKIQQKLLSLLTLKNIKKQPTSNQNIEQNVEKSGKQQAVQPSINVQKKQDKEPLLQNDKCQQQQSEKNTPKQLSQDNKIDQQPIVPSVPQQIKQSQQLQNNQIEKVDNLIHFKNNQVQLFTNERKVSNQLKNIEENLRQNAQILHQSNQQLKQKQKQEQNNQIVQVQIHAVQEIKQNQVIVSQEKNKSNQAVSIIEPVNPEKFKINSLMQRMKKLKQSKQNIKILPNAAENQQQITNQKEKVQSKLKQNQQVRLNQQNFNIKENEIVPVSVQVKISPMMEKMMKLKQQKLREEEIKKNAIAQQKQVENNFSDQQVEQDQNLKRSQDQQQDHYEESQQPEQDQYRISSRNQDQDQEQISSRGVTKLQQKKSKIFLKQIQKIAQITRKIKELVGNKSNYKIQQNQNQNFMNYIKSIELIANKKE